MLEIEEPERKKVKFPKTVFILVVLYFTVKFCHGSIRGVATLFLIDVLHYSDEDATIFFHAYLLYGCVFAVTGAILADSILGKFKSIIVHGGFFSVGMLLLSLTAVPPLHLPANEFTILSFIIIAFGYAVIKPVLVVFAASQFVLPEQEKELSLLFFFLCIVENGGAISSAFVTPILRKDFTCFDQLTCYPLVFIIPAAMLAIGTIIILLTKPLYKIQNPESNIIVRVSKCVFHALFQKLKSKEKRQHWLDFAEDQYDQKLIEDVKSISSVLVLLSPLFVFWALYSAQSSLWIFQATQMNGELWGYVIKPDQIHIIYSGAIIVLVPLLHSCVNPFLAKYLRLNTPLRRITLGCFITALAYYASTILELNLEPTYAKTPVSGLAQMRIYNTLDCEIKITIDEQKQFIINRLDILQDTEIPATSAKIITYELDYEKCSTIKSSQRSRKVKGNIQVVENQATSWAITVDGLDYQFVDRVEKSNSGDPVFRTLFYVDKDYTESQVDVKIVHKKEVFKRFKLPKERFIKSDFKDILHNEYDLYVNDQLVEANVPLKLGGVYTILGRISSSAVAAHTVTVTVPNSVHILWALPQQLLLAVAEIMVNVLVMEFAYSQAPSSMKAILQSYWSAVSIFGNILIIFVTKSRVIERKVYELLMYSILMTISSVIFAILCVRYKYINPSDDKPQEEVSKKNENSVE